MGENVKRKFVKQLCLITFNIHSAYRKIKITKGWKDGVKIANKTINSLILRGKINLFPLKTL